MATLNESICSKYDTLPTMLQDMYKMITSYYDNVQSIDSGCCFDDNTRWHAKLFCAGDYYNFKLIFASCVDTMMSVDKSFELKSCYENSDVMLTELDHIRDFFTAKADSSISLINFNINANGGKPLLYVSISGNKKTNQSSLSVNQDFNSFSKFRCPYEEDNQAFFQKQDLNLYKNMFFGGLIMSITFAPLFFLPKYLNMT